MPLSAWKGPFFVAFPGLKKAIQAGTPIATQGKFLEKKKETFNKNHLTILISS